MQDAGVSKRKIGVGFIVRSALIGLACGLTYELMGLVLQFAWDGIGIHSGPMTQVRFLQAFVLGLLMVALAGFLPAAAFRISGRELTIASVTGAVSGTVAGITLVWFDYLQHFHYFADRALSLTLIGYAVNVVAISPQFVLLITAACTIVAAMSALIYVTIDLEIG